MELSCSLLDSHRPFPLLSSLSLTLSLPTKPRAAHLIPKAQLPDSKPTGFGPTSEPRKKKNQGEGRDKIIRRSPIQKPSLLQEELQPSEGQQQQSPNETAFLLTWLGLGLLIFVEGILLAASGFLPEDWDNFFVKYLYPSFTPTVFLFVGGTVAYGVVKYLQGEEMKS
ncbi:uncharacterized protein A4U43_C01F12710 [Asparagus officinalis]|uniref:Protein LOW PSII ACCUMULATION 2, chloroplastic n=1 Tax=Asparagus officinalis TaxID=4686 RepID=A0A5P1FTF8_ASPOF|nr:protein LOW PSII ACCUMULATION 2, chloroplastic [Asparagus officinalis]XP_020243923.1 protein LOW PSII ACCUMULATION 2, chloroplastic [Asparagus officinalis]ONK80001.1 uncharacterized protein A4U43_C01F12710 [Asparagus officinalis]